MPIIDEIRNKIQDFKKIIKKILVQRDTININLISKLKYEIYFKIQW
jgi:hypothetical protein